MSSVSFNLDFHSYELNGSSVPVEIRRPNYTLVKQALSTESVTLDAGTYHVSARLPGGQELNATVDVIEPHTTVDLAPDEGEESPNEWRELQHFFGARQSSYGRALNVLKSTSFNAWTDSLAPPPPSPSIEPLGVGSVPEPVRLRWFRGNLLMSQYVVDAPSSFEPVEDMPQQIDTQDPPLTFVQLLQKGARPLNYGVPASPLQGSRLVISKTDDGEWTCNLHLLNVVANTLVQYQERGFAKEASQTLNSDAIDAEQLLFSKVQDPIAAAAGAYALLRFGELDRLHEWTKNLMDLFVWLPDGIVIRAEHLARMGEHVQALQLLLDLPSRGLPLFSAGLQISLDRLRYYIGVGERHFDPMLVSMAHSLVDRLNDFAGHTDFRRPLTTFSGLNPAHPDDEVFEGDIEAV